MTGVTTSDLPEQIMRLHFAFCVFEQSPWLPEVITCKFDVKVDVIMPNVLLLCA